MIFDQRIFDIHTASLFEHTAVALFYYQYDHNVVYRDFCKAIGIAKTSIKSIDDIPFLPISFFKTHQVISGKLSSKITFYSSGTTSEIRSKHHVVEESLYQESFRRSFSHFYGDISTYVVLALLPSYSMQRQSSLIYMVNHLIKDSHHPKSGYYLDNLSILHDDLIALESENRKILLIGVSYALLDMVDQYPCSLSQTIIMETGGMKGWRREMSKLELHQRLQEGFGVVDIHSEYGMTELLSQAYSFKNGLYQCPPWMQVIPGAIDDPLSRVDLGYSGVLNIIDLANIHSCAFIATEDIGRVYQDGRFEVLGRLDHADFRGCNLMVTS